MGKSTMKGCFTLSDIILTNHTCSSMTVISNLFLDTYLPKASGDAVKVYLLLLRYAGAGQSITISILANRLNTKESTIRSALSYWEKMGLLHITMDQQQQILSMQLLPVPQTSLLDEKEIKGEVPLDSLEKQPPLCRPIAEIIQSSSQTMNATKDSSSCLPTLPEKTSITPFELSKHPNSKFIEQILFVTERYFGKHLTQTDINTIFYIYDSLQFSDELLEYLIEYCTSIDKKSLRYAEKVAIGWYESGIKTVEQAKNSTKHYSKTYNSIMKAFGVAGRNLGSAELNYIDTWINTYHFPLSIILEACDRTIKTIYQPSFGYANKILKDWFESGAKTMEEITKLDTAHKATKKSPVIQKSTKAVATNNKFHNFEQRTYDYQALEQRFINKANGIATDQKEGGQ